MVEYRPSLGSTTQLWLPAAAAAVLVLVSCIFCTVSIQRTGNAKFIAPFVGSKHAWLARWSFFYAAETVIHEGHTKYEGKPWKLTGNDVIVLPHRYLNEIRKLPFHQANAMQANLDNMQSKFTHLDILNTTRLFVQVLKTKVNPQLALMIPTVRRELDAAFANEVPPPSINEGDWTSVPAFQTIHRIVGRVSARIFGGQELRDDSNWLNTAEGYLHNIFVTAITIRLVPYGFKTVASWFLPCSWKISWNFWKAKRILYPYIRYRKSIVEEKAAEFARKRRDEFPDVLQYLIEQATGRDAELMSLASMVLSLSLASNHTTAMALTEALYDLCTYPEYQTELREEVRSVIEADGGWRKTSLVKMRKLDSFIKESQRMRPPSLMGYKRKITENITLSDGLQLPAGAHVEFAIVPIQQDNTINSTEFDGLRYYRLRQAPSQAHRHQFATTSESVLHFGHGQNSCPGRFMASNVIKMTLGKMMLEYDFKLDQFKRPEGIHAFEYNFPNPEVHLLLRKRNQMPSV
ncbi:cytochrome P450, putative [Talaromyces stipitatus ATCC 10500]|uniref:Cytochrome P450, putative n=1 Tax=Talaromyces stipitatus (strain ATCC 10500 / CBS 375.48 / QM 6759 / NRRL 1006) TaxID=441959 RepID=B8LZQ3_TALSN|nr:cytochrome P450, putative [Talaromyces stipitatus ATCC 10500]XP_002487646.1 cytochrome P450, putative [Talaromyces stipitatus ATCC 10500]EED11992.1 cytochrome P450, putative [Talaromyces stipitatus ATCC 10500]EED20835.1 cytochrome P450, putative [Talaromyces stipitatus ATCC 10500]